MPLTRRYSPAIAPGEIARVGMDFSAVIPPGVAIDSGTLQIFTNTQPPVATTSFMGWLDLPPDPDRGKTFEKPRPVNVRNNRQLWVWLTAKDVEEDYALLWQAVDTDGSIWPRTALMLITSFTS